ncbi:MAG TPA: RNA polymerase sigma factor [Bacteroidales bacterium]|nr:hypothetical protein [Rikenellaceae bacterium]HON53977.1 RNA polymerase sigma factor [Bacteroidales bacterium]HRR49182.1 RNA polymerase sigma factor [Bacteroidales bacterium]HRT33793.1 RNA polymerase sigma factor [Bacteroidales bacterium]HRT83494.1 RNA polymerase sigma factor [Bacteroidales bacterium]
MTQREFEREIVRIRPVLLQFARSFNIVGASCAEDMVQEAVMRVWQSILGGEVVRSMEALTKRILRNVCLDYLRLKKNICNDYDIYGVDKIDSYDTARQLEIKEEFTRIVEIIKTLPVDQQLCIRLKDMMGFENWEIAEILNTTEVNVRTLLSRGRKSIRNELIMK